MPKPPNPGDEKRYAKRDDLLPKWMKKRVKQSNQSPGTTITETAQARDPKDPPMLVPASGQYFG